MAVSCALLLGAISVTVLLAVGTGAESQEQHVRKTIKSKDGDTIDCVDISHETHVKPSRSMKEMVAASGIGVTKAQQLYQTWRNGGARSCPAGTVPIRRASPWNNATATTKASFSTTGARDWDGQLEVAASYATWGPYHGVRADVPHWKIDVHPDEFSMSYLMVGYTLDRDYMPGPGEKPPKTLTNQIIVGLVAWPSLYGDSLSRSFVYYTNDSGVQYKCFNTECGGFRLTTNSNALGGAFSKFSEVGGERYGVTFGIHRDGAKEIWWVSVEDEDIGYFPANAFDTRFPEGSYVEMGGRVLNTRPGGRHTTTPMGSAMPACAGPRFAATIFYYLGVGSNGQLFKDRADRTVVTTPSCYDVRPLGFSDGREGFNVAFGGPGGIFCDHPEP